MKRILPMALSLLLCHCGTEVGNGIAPRAETGASTGQGTPTSAPESDGKTTNDSASPGDMLYTVISPSFLAACASPFAESIEGSFMDTSGTRGFTITVNADGRKTLNYLNSTTAVFVVTAAPSVSAYAIEALPQSPTVTCSAVTTQTMNDGSLQRSVTLSDGALVQWIVTAGKVTSMKTVKTGTTDESWSKK